MDAEKELDFILLEVTDCEGVPVPTGLVCPCEGEGAINIQTTPLGTTLSSLVANNELPASQLTNTCLAIAGRLIVDVNYSITGGQVRMQPGAEIVIPSGSQLTLQGINQNRGIHGCEQMWHAIRVLGTLNMSNCRVEDAAKAVQVEPAANFQQVTADITATTFNRNHIGVYLPPSTAGFFPFHLPNLNVNGCTFETDYSVSGSLLPPANPLPPQAEVGPPVTEFLGYPNVQEIGYIGILTNDLGSTNATISPNTFRNLLHGHVHNTTFTSVRVENSTFDDIKGTGVYGLEARLEVYDNNMTNCGTYGVFSRRLAGDTEVNGNDIDGANLGVYLLRCESARNIDVLDNDITDFTNQGIIATYMENNFDVSRNILSGASDADGLRGIYVTGDGTTEDSPSLNRFMVDNDISADSLTNGGITMSSLPGTEVARNQVVSNITDKPYIYISSSSNTIVADNNLEGGSTDWLYGNGVNIVASPNVKASCNEVRNVSQPLSFSLDCGCTDIMDPATCTEIIGNRLYAPGNGENYKGLLLRNAMVSQQERTGNEWYGVAATDPANVHDATFIGDPFTAFASEFITHTNNIPYYPQKIDGPGSWFGIEAGEFCDCESDCLNGGSGGGIAFAEGVAQEEYYTNVAGAQWVAERHLYRQLAENTALHTNGTLDSFYLDRQAHPIGAFYDAEQAIRNDLPLTLAEKTQLEQLQADVDRLQAELSTATGSHQASLERQLFYAQHQLEQYELELQLDRDNTVNTIVSDVQNINAQSTPAQNLQTALSIATRQKLSTVNSFTAVERTQLEVIAAQCVEQGGDGVLLARALLQWPNIQEPCSTNSALVKPNSAISANQAVAKLYPNPTLGELWLSTTGLEVEAEVFVELFNLSGQLLQRQAYLPNTTERLSLKEQPQGAYFYRVVQAGEVLSSGKLIKQ